MRRPIRKQTRKMLATAVMRCSQKCSVPCLAEPRPRTLARGVRRLMSEQVLEGKATHRECGRPDYGGRDQRGDDAEPGQAVGRLGIEALAGVPDQVAHPAEH